MNLKDELGGLAARRELVVSPVCGDLHKRDDPNHVTRADRADELPPVLALLPDVHDMLCTGCCEDRLLVRTALPFVMEGQTGLRLIHLHLTNGTQGA